MSIQRIGKRYQVDARIGEGGMGTVYRGIDTVTQEVVAIKHLKPDLLAYEPQMLARFEREAEVLRQLNHPYIVKPLAALQEGEDHYIVLEFVGGGSLADTLRSQPHLPVQRVLEIALDLSDALIRAHRLNIIHRDLKPANILLADDGSPRLTDFGIAFMHGKEHITETHAIVGTLDYLSPEAFEGSDVDARSDIWAFGVVLFEMLAGQRPFSGTSLSQTMNAILAQPPADLEALRSDCSVALVDLVYRMLEKDKNQRIPSMRQVGAELENILQGRESAAIPNPDYTPTPAPITLLKHNLPAQSTAFIGREEEITELTRTVATTQTRLVTILAPGGMGKTRLSLEVAAQFIENTQHQLNFADGVYFVSLAPLTSPEFIVSTIAESLEFQFYGGVEPRQQVVDYLREKSLLLVMDNFEHVLEGVGIVADILIHAPQVKVIATSRERLNLSGETLFPLSGMDFPQWETPADALNYAAVNLFMQSAQRIRPDFELVGDDLVYLARICRLLAGMPLAIVLAAVWLEMLTLAEIADEIAKGIDFLETELRDIPTRQRSIRAVFDYAWQHLTNDERRVFMKLSVFRGGFTRDSAQGVAGASLKILMALVNKSLIRRDATTGRYEIHELLRQYAEMQLEASGDSKATHDAHGVYFVNFLQQREEPLKTHKQLMMLNEVEGEWDNLRVMWDDLCHNRQVADLRRATFSFWLAADLSSRFHEMVDLFGQAAEALYPLRGKLEVDVVYGLMLSTQGWFYVGAGNPEQGWQVAQMGVEIVRQWGKAEDLFFALYGLGLNLQFLGQWELLEQIGYEMIFISRQTGNQWALARSLLTIAPTLIVMGRANEILPILEEGYPLAENLGELWLKGVYNAMYGNYFLEQANYPEAKARFALSKKLFEELEQPYGIGRSDQALGVVATRLHEFSEAYYHFHQSLKQYTRSNQSEQMLGTLADMAELFILQAKPVRALELISLVLNHPQDFGYPRFITDPLRAQLEAELAPEVYATAWERGKSLDLKTVVAEFMAEEA